MKGFLLFLEKTNENLLNQICEIKKIQDKEKVKDTAVTRLDKFKNIVLLKQLADKSRNNGVFKAIDEET